MAIFTPVNQIRLTNIAIVRLKKGGKRFEIACYPNKVTSWRKGLEPDLDEVVQSHEIFLNVSKGITAKKDDLQRCFKQSDQEKILLTILKQGEIQVTGKERQVQRENIFQEVATIVAEKCVDSDTQRPLTVGYVESSMKDLHWNPNPSKSAKAQALDVIKLLEENLPVKRAQMKVQVELPGKDAKKIADKVRPYFASIEQDDYIHPRVILVGIIEPKDLRNLETEASAATRGQASVSVLNLAVGVEEDMIS
jgi:ribosome maturation protein SDO1